MPKKIVETAHLIERVKENPENYPICLNMACGKRERCLHALETTDERMKCVIVTCVNPLTCGGEDGCPEFRDRDARAQYAFGMKKIARMMKSHGVYQAFVRRCLCHFCRTVFYDMHAGHRIIYPHEQLVILGCATALGVQLPADSFDQMVETVAW